MCLDRTADADNNGDDAQRTGAAAGDEDCFKSAISKPPPGSADPAIRRARRAGKDLCYSHLNKFMPQVYL